MNEKPYVAKGPHKRPCDLCGTEVRPGDRMLMWAWTNDQWDGPGTGFGDIMRVHEPCHALSVELRLGEWEKGAAFRNEDSDYREGEQPWQRKAEDAVAAMRAVR